MAPEAIPELLEQIDELLAEPVQTEEPATLDRLERTLTDGYAYALALEAEGHRLERRLSELAGELNDGDQERKTKELAQVSDRLSSNAGILTALRETLTQLRARSSALRSNAP